VGKTTRSCDIQAAHRNLSCLPTGFRGLVRREISLYTPFLRHYGGYKNDAVGGFPVENQAEIRGGLRKTLNACKKKSA
jgi:hypothetical protein